MMEVSRHSGRLAAMAAVVFSLVVQLPPAARAGDSLYGKVTAVKRADLVTFDHGAGSYDIRIAGVEVPDDPAIQEQAVRFTTELLLGKPARMRFNGRTEEGEMVGRLYTDDPELGIMDVGIEMVRAGMAVPTRDARGYKYGEPEQALEEARSKQLGVWGVQQ